jgi:hypothetical protein
MTSLWITWPYNRPGDPLPYIPPYEFYNYLRGLWWDGTDIFNPNTGNPTKFFLPGDPETATGWYEGEGWPGGPAPGDRRMVPSMGPFNMSPGDTQEVVIGILMAKGSSHKNSVTVLKKHAAMIRSVFNDKFTLTPAVPVPVNHAVPMENAVTLWWENNAEDFTAEDNLLPDTLRFSVNENEYVVPVDSGNYYFEGYRIWQFSDENGSDPVLLGVADKKNGVKQIRHFSYEYLLLNGGYVPQDPLITSPDSGIYNFFNIREDAFNHSSLVNGSSYFFGVTAYAYSKYSDPPVIESKPFIAEVIPGRLPIDAELPYGASSNVLFEHISGAADADVFAHIIDPTLLTGHTYEVNFNFNKSFNLINKTTGDTLISNSTALGTKPNDKQITDGFVLMVENRGDEQLGTYISKIRSVDEVKGPAGIVIEPPKFVFSTRTNKNLNSTGKWTVRAVSNESFRQEISDDIQKLAYRSLYSDDYEVRFTSAGSEYYSSGYYSIEPLTKNDPKGKGRLPFEVWRISSDTSKKPERLIIKIIDRNKDTAWTRTENIYEAFYTFVPAIPYPEILPPSSISDLGGNQNARYKVGNFVLEGELPETGTVIKVTTWKPLTSSDKFRGVLTAPKSSSQLAKQNINNISVFPNPYYGASSLRGEYPSYVRFTNLPPKLSIRIFSLSGVFIKKIEKDELNQYIDWDLRNKDGLLVGSGVYLAYLDIPGVATRVMKIGVVK